MTIKRPNSTKKMRKLIYLVQWFRPTKEATSKEVNVLYHYFKRRSILHNLHLNSLSEIKLGTEHISYHFIFYLLFFPLLYLLSSKKIIHIYSGLNDRCYLSYLPKKRTILTSTNFFESRKIKKMKALKKIHKIIVEAEIQKEELLKLGMDKKKIEVIYPPVDLNKFVYKKACGTFKILNATCPSRARDFTRRGLILLFESDRYLEGTTINFLWRDGFYLMENILKLRKFKNLMFKNILTDDMNKEFSRNHCTIIPYTRFDEYLKLIPLSAIESLAAGKPVLTSSKTGIASIIKKERCGVTFEPNKDSLREAINELKKNYYFYQKNCRKTAEKYFSQEQFLRRYNEIYTEMEEK